MDHDVIFSPLHFRHLSVKNRLFRSSISGRFDSYDGSGRRERINWELKFAKGGVGAIISAFSPISIPGRILPNFATIHTDRNIPFWRALVEAVHEYDCKYILQLSHCGRQQDIGGIENVKRTPLSATNQTEAVHGLACRAMSREEIRDVIRQFAQAARRAREAGIDGVELHACHGYLITQFLSSGINDRTDEYGGSLKNRARLLLEIIREIRKEVGRDYHLQVKINGTDYNNAVYFWHKKGNQIDETAQICKWIEEAGADAIHVSTGSFFPHPLSPPGPFPIEDLSKTYGAMLAWGQYAFRNYLLFRFKLLRPLFLMMWNRTLKREIEGLNLEDSGKVKKNVSIPVICVGGFQTASVIRRAIEQGMCDGVAMARTLVANPDLPAVFAQGRDCAEKPCTYCNKCLGNVLEHPIGCYELSRYDGDYEKMVNEIFRVFDPPEHWDSNL